MELVEELFGSKARTMILSIMADNGTLNISDVARSAGTNHGLAEQHLKKLMEMGLIREKRFDTRRVLETAFREVVVKFEKGLGVRVDRDEHEPPHKRDFEGISEFFTHPEPRMRARLGGEERG